MPELEDSGSLGMNETASPIAGNEAILDNEPITDPTPEDGQGGDDYFYSYESDNGEVSNFKDQNEVREYIRSGTLRQGDYTRKTQELAKQRKEFETNQANFDTGFKDLKSATQQMNTQKAQLDRVLKSLPAHIYKQVVDAAKAGDIRPQDIASSPEFAKLTQRLDDRDAKDQKIVDQQAQETAVENAHLSLAKAYPNYNRETVLAEMDRLGKIAPGDDQRSLMELIYYAGLGRQNPAKLEQNIAENLERKQNLKAPMTKTVKVPKGQPQVYASLDEAAEAARENSNGG